MGRQRKAKAAELETRAARKQKTRKPNSHTSGNGAQASERSAANWLLDATTYARDGDRANARAAALRGLDALGAR
jgi:hypothetical protein